MPDEDSLRHKYAPLPEEPRFRRKKAKKKAVHSDHKHEYEKVCIDAHSRYITRDGEFPAYHIGIRCKVCGRLQDIKLWAFMDQIPEGMPIYEVDDLFEMVKMKTLPDEMRVSE